MSQRDKIIQIAAEQIGYREKNNNLTKFGAWYGMDGSPWCAMFVSWCAAQAGIPTSVVPKLSYVPNMVDFFKRRGLYKPRGYLPKKGDIVFFGSSSHVGLVESATKDAIVTIEGNTAGEGNVSNGDGVCRRTRSLGNGSWVMGYGTPEYEEEEEVKRWRYLNDVPAGYYRQQAERLIAEGVLKGKEDGTLDITEDMLRTILIVERIIKAQ